MNRKEFIQVLFMIILHLMMGAKELGKIKEVNTPFKFKKIVPEDKITSTYYIDVIDWAKIEHTDGLVTSFGGRENIIVRSKINHNEEG